MQKAGSGRNKGPGQRVLVKSAQTGGPWGWWCGNDDFHKLFCLLQQWGGGGGRGGGAPCIWNTRLFSQIGLYMEIEEMWAAALIPENVAFDLQ